MLFNSLEFLFFIIPVYGLYLVLNHRWQNRLLIAASCLFYAAWNWKFLFVMFVSITTDFFCARYMERVGEDRKRRLLLALSLAVNFSILAFFKYFNFFAANLQALLAYFHIIDPHVRWFLNIILPLGISFYTFEAVSYVVDVYRRQTPAAKNYWDYVLFVIYFPHLIAGPIMRAKSFLPQITTARVVSLEGFYQGCHLFFWGLFEKMFVADNLAKLADPVFASAGPYRGPDVLLALYAFAFQILCDFDGYSNMARGLGKCMGFDITINFKWPYFAINPRDFWQRWHISLSSWLRDYLYIPLGGNRCGPSRMYMALFVTMLLGGFWHGAAWTFVLWGAYHGALLVIYRRFNPGKPMEEKRSFLKIAAFFHLVVLGWLFFRGQSLGQIAQMLHALAFNFQLQRPDLIPWMTLAGFTLPFLAIQIWQFKANDFLVIYRQHWLVKTAIYAFLTYLWFGWAVLKPEEFIYFQF